MLYSRAAERHIDGLREHYRRIGRLEATRNLAAALAEAEARIERNPALGLAAPRAYPEVARIGRAWVKAGRYWINYRLTDPPVIVGVFFETADIPGRFEAP